MPQTRLGEAAKCGDRGSTRRRILPDRHSAVKSHAASTRPLDQPVLLSAPLVPLPRFLRSGTRSPARHPLYRGLRDRSHVADDKSVAVLAFANVSNDKANEYFSDGISEELLNVLAKVPGLKVTARTSAFHFKGKDLSTSSGQMRPKPRLSRRKTGKAWGVFSRSTILMERRADFGTSRLHDSEPLRQGLIQHQHLLVRMCSDCPRSALPAEKLPSNMFLGDALT